MRAYQKKVFPRNAEVLSAAAAEYEMRRISRQRSRLSSVAEGLIANALTLGGSIGGNSGPPLPPERRPQVQRATIVAQCVADSRYLDGVINRDLAFISRIVERKMIVLEPRVLLLHAYHAVIHGRIGGSWKLLRRSVIAAEEAG